MADRYIPEHRRTQFKAKSTFKPEELRRRREEQQVEIRKAKREENLAKRRGIGIGDNRPGASLGAAPDSDDESTPTENQVRLPRNFFLSTRARIFNRFSACFISSNSSQFALPLLCLPGAATSCFLLPPHLATPPCAAVMAHRKPSLA